MDGILSIDGLPFVPIASMQTLPIGLANGVYVLMNMAIN